MTISPSYDQPDPILSNSPSIEEYDVVIVGAGLAGLTLVRFLNRHVPQCRIAIVDPSLGKDRVDHKVGEALIEWSTCFLVRELGLSEYMDRVHPKKRGILWQYAKGLNGDRNIVHLERDANVFYNPRDALLKSYFVDRTRLETDLERMLDRNTNVTFIQGFAADWKQVICEDGSTSHMIKWQCANKKASNVTREVGAKFFCDASGRRFFSGFKSKNLHRKGVGPLKQSAAWIRVVDFDKSILDREGLVQWREDGSENAPYFSTNHWCRKGAYTWLIPLDKEISKVSIGVTYYPKEASNSGEPLRLHTQDDFMEYLHNSYRLLAELADSGRVHDFKYKTNLAHESHQYYSNGSASIGDASAFVDPMGSPGIGLISDQVCQTSALIEHQLSVSREQQDLPMLSRKYRNKYESEAYTLQERIDAYNAYFRELLHLLFELFSVQKDILQSTEAMSFHVSMFNAVYFGAILPGYLSQQILNVAYCRKATQTYFPVAKSMTKDSNDALRSLGKQYLPKLFPVMFQFATWNIILYHTRYCKQDSFEDNDALEPQKINPDEVFEMYRKYTSIQLGQLRAWTYGCVRGCFQKLHSPALAREYFVGVVSMSSPMAYYLLALIPMFWNDKSYRLPSSVSIDRWIPQVFPEPIMSLMKSIFRKCGVAPSFLSTKPTTTKATTHFLIRYIPSAIFAGIATWWGLRQITTEQ